MYCAFKGRSAAVTWGDTKRVTTPCILRYVEIVRLEPLANHCHIFIDLFWSRLRRQAKCRYGLGGGPGLGRLIGAPESVSLPAVPEYVIDVPSMRGGFN